MFPEHLLITHFLLSYSLYIQITHILNSSEYTMNRQRIGINSIKSINKKKGHYNIFVNLLLHLLKNTYICTQ